jgi:transposase, IS5 family
MKRALSLEEMEQVVPWRESCSLIEPHYPKLAMDGRRREWSGRYGPISCRSDSTCRIRRWKRRCTTRRCCASSQVSTWGKAGTGRDDGLQVSPRAEGAPSGRSDAADGESVSTEPGSTDRDRHHRRCNHYSFPRSTKDREQQRDPAMHQTRKGKQWYFGMKAHVGVDSKTKMIHSVVATAANVADSAVLPELLHGEETKVWGDQAYRGQTEVTQEVAPRDKDQVDEIERAKNRTKSRVRSKVEHVFGVMKLISWCARSCCTQRRSVFQRRPITGTGQSEAQRGRWSEGIDLNLILQLIPT